MLGPEQVGDYAARGFITVPALFTAAELAPVEEYLVRNQDVAWSNKNDDPLREAHYHHRPIYDVCTAPKLLDCVEALLGPDLVLLYSHILNKPPGGLRVAWHQDGPYWWRVEPKVAVTAWVALDDATVENGCMRVIPGTHRGNVDLGQRSVEEPDLIQARPFELPAGVFDEARAVDLLMRRGDVSFHHSYLVHGSDPNQSVARRAALTIRYVTPSTRIQNTPDRRQYLVRGAGVHNGNVYFQFGT